MGNHDRRVYRKGSGGRFAVYRVRGLSEEEANTPPRIANDYLHTPFDAAYGSNTTALYGAELVRLSFRGIGMELGRETRIAGRKLVTPQSLADDQRVVCIYSTFPEDTKRCSNTAQ